MAYVIEYICEYLSLEVDGDLQPCIAGYANEAVFLAVLLGCPLVLLKEFFENAVLLAVLSKTFRA